MDLVDWWAAPPLLNLSGLLGGRGSGGIMLPLLPCVNSWLSR